MSDIAYRPLEGRGRWTVWACYTYGAAALLLVPGAFTDATLSYWVFPGVEPVWIAEPLYWAMIAATGLFFAAYVASGLLYLAWVYRAARNVRALGALNLPTSPGWAVGWYFVPIANIWKPFEALKDIWSASISAPAWRKHEPPSIVGWFQLVAIFDYLVGRVAETMYEQRVDSASYEPRFDGLTVAELAGMMLSLWLAWLTIQVVTQITGAQEAQHAEDVFS